MITEEFKKQLREFLISVFEVRSSVLYSPYSLSEDMSFDEDLFMIRAPLLVGEEILEFFKSEGLKVEKMPVGLFKVSPFL